MQPTTVTSTVTIGGYAVTRLDDNLAWGVGAIRPQAGLDDDASQRQLIETVVSRLVPVADDELAYSLCTDGRVPVRLLNGDTVPVREQIVGTDTMVFFHMAEVLAERFYEDVHAPLASRLEAVVQFMQDNGLVPCTHIACGAAAGYVPITENLVAFAQHPQFVARQRALLPEGVYNEAIRQQITAGYQERLAANAYADWSADLLMDVIKRVSGDRAIAELNDDGRGVHGHVEEQIIRIKAEGVAIDEAGLASQTSGREVFGVNDARLVRHAKLISKGIEADYWMALMAAEDFTDGGHGTLAKNLPTYVIRKG